MSSMLVHGGRLTDGTPAHLADDNYEVNGQDHFGDWAGQVYTFRTVFSDIRCLVLSQCPRE
jgi:hypothetical protein